MTVKPIPDGFHSITPGMNIVGCEEAIAFYKKAFGAEERMCMRGARGKIAHAELQIGDSVFMLSEAVDNPVQTMSVMLYVTDCDAVWKRAVDAGATAVFPPKDMFYGDRAGRLRDAYGNEWFIATHKEDVSPEELKKRMQSMSAANTPT